MAVGPDGAVMEQPGNVIELSGNRDWGTSTFDCFGDFKVCLYGYFCGPCMMLDNIKTVKENATFAAVMSAIGMGSCFCLPMVLMGRQKMRHMLGIQGTAHMDICCYMFCSSCTECQQYREAKATGIQDVCCCAC